MAGKRSFSFSLFRLMGLVATSQFQSDSSINTIKITAKKISVSRQRQNLLLNRSLLSVRPVRKFAHLIEFSSTVLLALMVPQENWYLAKKKKKIQTSSSHPSFFPKILSEQPQISGKWFLSTAILLLLPLPTFYGNGEIRCEIPTRVYYQMVLFSYFV